MRFCAVLRSYPKDTPGGAEYQAYLICRELAKRGHDTHYVAHQSETSDVSTDDGIVVHRLHNNTTSDVIDCLKNVEADVYYFRIAHDLPLLWRAKRQMAARFVYNVSRDVQCQPLFAGTPYRDSEPLLNGILARGKYALYRYLLRTPDLVFVQSRQQQRLLEKHHSLRSTIIGNGHPIPETDFEKESPPVVLWLASLKQVKNPETFIRLFEATNDLPCQFWIVGRPVDDEIYTMVQQKISESDKIEYLGGCGILESNEYFKKAAVYVHTGDLEGFPNTFIQSWLHRTPVLSFCTDPDSALADNETGFHCETMSEAESILRQLINEDEYRAKVGDTAHKYGREHHSIEVIVDKIEKQFGRVTDFTPDKEA